MGHGHCLQVAFYIGVLVFWEDRQIKQTSVASWLTVCLKCLFRGKGKIILSQTCLEVKVLLIISNNVFEKQALSTFQMANQSEKEKFNKRYSHPSYLSTSGLRVREYLVMSYLFSSPSSQAPAFRKLPFSSPFPIFPPKYFWKQTYSKIHSPSKAFRILP